MDAKQARSKSTRSRSRNKAASVKRESDKASREKRERVEYRKKARMGGYKGYLSELRSRIDNESSQGNNKVCYSFFKYSSSAPSRSNANIAYYDEIIEILEKTMKAEGYIVKEAYVKIGQKIHHQDRDGYYSDSDCSWFLLPRIEVAW